MINLISDTVTKPTPDMLESMMKARVGDDVFGEDPTVNALEERLARMFDHEAALFCPSGTMTNQIALKCNTQPLDEVICDITSHIYQYEVAGYAFNSGIGVNLLHGDHGKIDPDMITAAIKPEFDWLPRTSLVSIENSCNRGGGSYYTLEEMRAISELARSHSLRIHLDGARLFNVLVETGDDTKEVGPLFDTISICLSKGLGAPVGSVLIGSKDLIHQARRYRKVMGGGMRQVGILAAAGLYALDHNVDRLKTDNERAKKIGECLDRQGYVDRVRPVQTNIVIFDLKENVPAEDLVDVLKSKGINSTTFGANSVRFVTHLDLSEKDIEKVLEVLDSIDL
ncbi:MAG: GntG family PLP-dependent aldolase [Saprospiraceae bacterium]|nr:GntG family PLP-dependent aldolase [Saprospiraceae bacterium]